MIYFDNAATSFFKPQLVKNRVIECMESFTANPGRSGHKSAIRSSQKVNEVRERVARFFDADPSRVVFTHNCTTALNMAILGSVQKGMHVITTAMEHNSVLRPLHRLQKEGIITLDIVPINHNGCVTADDIEMYTKADTKLLVITHTSNVTGAVNDISSIGQYCHSKGIRMIVDCAQSAGHTKISLDKDNIDILCFAGHKGLYSLASIGGLVLADGVSLRPVILGGTGVSSESIDQEELFPDNFESGTISTPLIISLGAGVEYVDKNFDFINTKTKNLIDYAFVRLQYVPNIQIYSNPQNCHGVISFNIRDCDCHDLATYLDTNYGIAVRSGLHCAPLIHKQLGTLDLGGAVRISLNHKNTPNEIDLLVDALIKYQDN